MGLVQPMRPMNTRPNNEEHDEAGAHDARPVGTEGSRNLVWIPIALVSSGESI
jgi:hypothetical protein